MKRSLVCLFFMTVVAGCSDIKESEEYQSVATYSNYLEKKLEGREKELEEITNSVVQIENNLATIRKKERLIGELTRTTVQDRTEQINATIAEIGGYLNENQKMVAGVEDKLNKSEKKNVGLANLVAQLRRSVTEKEKQIQEMRTTIVSLRSTVVARE